MSFLCSVIVATFGSEEWSELAFEALDSATVQEPFEAFALHHPDGTLAEVRNAAARSARGDWLCFLDADDSLAPDYLAAMREAEAALPRYPPTLSHFEIETRPLIEPALLAPAVQFVRDGHRLGKPEMINPGGWPYVNECVIGTLIPRALFLEVGGFRDVLDDGLPLNSLEDYDLFLRCWEARAQIVHVPDAVYLATMRPTGWSRNRDQTPYSRIVRESQARAPHLWPGRAVG